MKRAFLFALMLAIVGNLMADDSTLVRQIRRQKVTIKKQTARIALLERAIVRQVSASKLGIVRQEYNDERINIHFDENGGISYILRPQFVRIFIVENKKKKFAASCVDNFGRDLPVISTQYQYIKSKGK